jgi:hypothetical protein
VNGSTTKLGASYFSSAIPSLARAPCRRIDPPDELLKDQLTILHASYGFLSGILLAGMVFSVEEKKMIRHWIIAVASILSVGTHGQEIAKSSLVPQLTGCDGSSRQRFDLVLDNGAGKTAAGTTFSVKPLTIINTGKDKPGKKITAVVIDRAVSVGNTVVRHNAKVIGHIEEMQKLDETHHEARLRLVFDQIKLKHGRRLAFVGVVHEVDAESIANSDYWVFPPNDLVGYSVRISDWPDASEIRQYCYSEDTGQGIVFTSKKSNIHVRYHAILTLRVVESQAENIAGRQKQHAGGVNSSIAAETSHSNPP